MRNVRADILITRQSRNLLLVELSVPCGDLTAKLAIGGVCLITVLDRLFDSLDKKTHFETNRRQANSLPTLIVDMSSERSVQDFQRLRGIG